MKTIEKSPMLSHILLVDDDGRLRNLLERYLTKNNFRVTCAEDGRQARKFLDIFEFDMILLDVMMPGETGIELTKYLRAFNSVPILKTPSSSSFTLTSL